MEKITFLNYKNIELRKSKNFYFLRGFVQGFVKNKWNFFLFSLLSKIGQNKGFRDPVDRNMNFLDLENTDLRKLLKNEYFSKGASPWFWSKIWKFIQFLFCDLVDGEIAFLDCKNIALKKS